MLDPTERKERQLRQAIDSELAMVEYRAAEVAIREKTACLRAARLAREAVPVIILPAPSERGRGDQRTPRRGAPLYPGNRCGYCRSCAFTTFFYFEFFRA